MCFLQISMYRLYPYTNLIFSYRTVNDCRDLRGCTYTLHMFALISDYFGPFMERTTVSICTLATQFTEM